LSKFELIGDSYEQQREKFTDYKYPKKYYSGQQKKPSLKN